MHTYQAEIKYLEDWEAQRCPIFQAEFLLPGFLEAHIIKLIYIRHRSSCQHMESCLRVCVCVSSSLLQTWEYHWQFLLGFLPISTPTPIQWHTLPLHPSLGTLHTPAPPHPSPLTHQHT